MKNIGIFSLLILFLFSSCRKNINEVKVTQTIPNPIIEEYIVPVEDVVSGLIGIVVDENNNPVTDAVVTIDNLTLTSDPYGHFFVESETMNALGTLVEVVKEGYFKGSRRFFPKAEQTNRIKIQLLQKTFDNSFASSSGGTVNFGNGASVEFFPNSIKTSSGDIYQGNVNVAAKWLDPTSMETTDQMPGNLQGLNKDVELKALATYGMIAVELEGDGGESLNIADGNTAKITMPVPSSLLSAAPNQIPLWAYHDELGLWVEESVATLENGNYVGEVPHFSFWNCDFPYDGVQLDMTLVDQNGAPVANYVVHLSLSNNSVSSGGGFTDEQGNISGLVPVNELLTMRVFSFCGEQIFMQEIGPFSTNTSLGNVEITLNSVNATVITGTLLDCDNNPITNGVVIVTYDGYYFYHYTSTSNFSISLTSCPSTANIQVVGKNLDDLQQSTALNALPNVQTDLGDIYACIPSSGSIITITVEENGMANTTVFPMSTASFVDSTVIEFSGIDESINIVFQGNSVGDYSSTNYINMLDSFSSGWVFAPQTPTPSFSTFVVTQFDNRLVGYFNGVLLNQISGDMVIVNGTFDIEL